MKAIQADITTLAVDAIVNAANSSLLGGGGVDGAIHRAAGPELVAECRLLGGCKTGEAKITKGYRLPAKHVIHTVGPIYGRHNGQEPELLSACYRNSVSLAVEHGLASIAFPSISTGAYGYPKHEAAKVVHSTVAKLLDQHDIEIRLVFFSPSDAEAFKKHAKRGTQSSEFHL